MYKVDRITYILWSVCFQSFLRIYKHVCVCVFFNLNEIRLHVLFWFLNLLLNLVINILFVKPHQVLYVKYF